MIDIQKHIPIPPDVRGPQRKYPFRKMDVGDSFFTAGSHATISGSINAYRKRSGKTFTARKVDGGIRVWRTS